MNKIFFVLATLHANLHFYESISSSPSKSDKSIHKVRLLRKNKRKKLDENIQNPDHKKGKDADKILFDFYNDSDELDGSLNKDNNSTYIISKPSAIIENYKPFKVENLLAMADRLTSNQRDDRSKIEFPENQGFYTCQTMKEKGMFDTLTKQESSFLITESELINCCDQAEKVFEEKEPYSLKIDQGSPNQKMALVNSILQDFSQSPLTKDDAGIYTWQQHTPEFRFRRKSIKTYSRKCLNRIQTNLSKRLISVTSDDDGNSNCSSISTQENVAPLEGVYNGAVTDTSQKLCQNFLNLSAFFTEKTSTNSSQDINDHNCSEKFLTSSSQERLLNNIYSSIHEILKLRSTCPDKLTTDSTYCSNQDFYGFPCQKEGDVNAIDLVAEYEHIHLNKTLIEHNLPVHEQKVDITSDVNNKEYNDWIEDGCEDVFTTINSDAILLQNMKTTSDPTSHKLSSNMGKVFELVSPKSPKLVEKNGEFLTNESFNNTQNPTQYLGFKTASSKAIKVSRNAHIVAAKILSKLPDIPNKTRITNYDNQVVIKDSTTTTKEVNIFENPGDYEWNDDCDFFLNFRTPVLLNEKQHKERIVKEKFSYANDFPSTSKMAMKANIGFQTAAGKNVAITEKSEESVQRFLKGFDEHKDCDDLNEIKMKIYTKKHNLKTQNTNLQNIVGKSDYQFNANENVEKISDSATNSIESHDKVSSKYEGILDIKDTSEKQHQYELSKKTFNGNMGFQTAQGKNIKISKQAQQSVKKLLNEFDMDSNENFESDLVELKHKINQKHSKAITDVNNIQSAEYNKISNKQIKVLTNIEQSEELTRKSFTKREKSTDYDKEPQAKNSSKVLLNEIIGIQNNFEDNIVEDLQKIKKNNRLESKQKSIEIFEKNEEMSNIVLAESNYSEPKINESKSTELLNKNCLKAKEISDNHINDYNSGTSKNCDTYNKQISSIIGFQTAKGNKLSISSKAQQIVDKLLQEFRSDLNGTNFEESLMDMKSKIEIKNKQFKRQNNNLNLKSTEEKTEYSNIIFSEWPLNAMLDLTQNATPKQLMRKRKLSVDNSDIPSPTTARSSPSMIINKELYSTKNSVNELTIKSPLNSPATSIISRKNLLSLTKRRKNKRNLMGNLNQDSNEKQIPKIYKELVATPIKSSIGTSIQTPATPNLKDFFSHVPQTSTPREENKSSKSPHKAMDGDFKPINWDNNNDSTNNISKLANVNRTTKLSDSTCSNISFNSSNPTAKERIARLKMYGKPPAVSPILIVTHDSCRPSGLRRTRSMLKKTENK